MLAFYPTNKGFAFCIAESTERIIDFGSVSQPNQKKLLERFCKLLDKYFIDCVITECFDAKSKRSSKAKKLVEQCTQLSLQQEVKVSSVNSYEVKSAFHATGALTKYERACVVAKQIRPLAPYLRAKRKIYQSEHPSMHLFEAAALLLTY